MFAASKTGAGATAKDPYFNNTALLLHGDGTNGTQNNTFVDSSSNNFAITRNGDTTQGTFTPFSQTGWSNYFNGSSDYLSFASNVAFGFSTGDFTLEAWIYSGVAFAANTMIFDLRSATPATGQPVLYVSSTGKLIAYIEGTGNVVTGTTTISANSWNHVCVSKSSGTYRVFLNGVSEGTPTANSVSVPTSPVIIGADYVASSKFTGYVSNARIVKGTAVYTSNFTPSTAPLTAISGTSLLTCQSNRFIDNSSNAFSITTYGAPSVQPFSPFAPTAAYSTSTVGGSGYFDGSGDYLTLANNAAYCNFGTGDFDISGWINVADLSVERDIISCGVTWTTSLAFNVGVRTDGKIWVHAGNSAPITISGGAITPNTWNYFVVSRVSGTTTLYVNGTSVASSAASATISSAATLYIGAQYMDATLQNPWKGYISNLRVRKGVGAASGAVPTSPSTSDASTSLLCNFTNAGIYDQTAKNDLQTVGSAQVSTAQKKYGTGAMLFNGTSDYLQIPDNQSMVFGSGDFTIEAWIYPTQVAAGEAPIFKLHDGNNVLELRQNTNKLDCYLMQTNPSITTSSGTISMTVNTWNHVAFVRSGTTTYTFVNGVLDQTKTGQSQNLSNLATTKRIGSNQGAAYFFAGYIDDFRITKGYARYTANFTPSTTAFPNQ